MGTQTQPRIRVERTYLKKVTQVWEVDAPPTDDGRLDDDLLDVRILGTAPDPAGKSGLAADREESR